jgi:vacuolar protein sorting-associated protein 13A/C
VSLINRQLMEVVYLSLSNLKAEYASSSVAQSVTVACGSLQIDNQLHDAIFPVVLQPTPLGKEAGVAALPTVQASLIWLNDQCTRSFHFWRTLTNLVVQRMECSSSSTSRCSCKP